MPARRIAISLAFVVLAAIAVQFFLADDFFSPSIRTRSPEVAVERPVPVVEIGPTATPAEIAASPTTGPIRTRFSFVWLGDQVEVPLDLQIRRPNKELVKELRDLRDPFEVSLPRGEYDFSFSDGVFERYANTFVFDAPREQRIEIGMPTSLVDVEIVGPGLAGEPVTLHWLDEPGTQYDLRVGDVVQIESSWGIRKLQLQADFLVSKTVTHSVPVFPYDTPLVAFALSTPSVVKLRVDPPLDDGCSVRVTLEYRSSWHSAADSRSGPPLRVPLGHGAGELASLSERRRARTLGPSMPVTTMSP